jgi:hypothetical protein
MNMAEAALTPEAKPALRHPLLFVLRGYISVAMPFLLALIAIRFVMSPLYLQLEYNRSDFP